MNIPPVDPALLDYLDRTYPARHPDISWSERRVWFEAGKRALVDDLRALMAAQEEDAKLQNVLRGSHVYEEAKGGGTTSAPAAPASPAGGGNRLR